MPFVIVYVYETGDAGSVIVPDEDLDLTLLTIESNRGAVVDYTWIPPEDEDV